MAANVNVGAMVSWGEWVFARFAFDLVALLAGAYDVRRLSSFHGMSWIGSD